MSIRGIDAAGLVLPSEVTSIERAPSPAAGAPAVGGTSFASILGDAVQEASAADVAAGEKAQALAAGAVDDLHGTMITMKQAGIEMKLIGSVRNKLLDAFQELWRTSV